MEYDVVSDIFENWGDSPVDDMNIYDHVFFIGGIIMDVGCFLIISSVLFYLSEDWIDMKYLQNYYRKTKIKFKIFCLEKYFKYIHKKIRCCRKPKWTRKYYVMLKMDELDTEQRWYCHICNRIVIDSICKLCDFKAFRWFCYFCHQEMPSHILNCAICDARSKNIRICPDCLYPHSTSVCPLCRVRDWSCSYCLADECTGEKCINGHNAFKWNCICSLNIYQYGNYCFMCKSNPQIILTCCVCNTQFSGGDICPKCDILQPRYTCSNCAEEILGAKCPFCDTERTFEFCKVCKVIHDEYGCPICKNAVNKLFCDMNSNCLDCDDEMIPWICVYGHINSCVNCFPKCNECRRNPVPCTYCQLCQYLFIGISCPFCEKYTMEIWRCVCGEHSAGPICVTCRLFPTLMEDSESSESLMNVKVVPGVAESSDIFLWDCVRCHHVNSIYNDSCIRCSKPPISWTCKYCFINTIGNKCYVCNRQVDSSNRCPICENIIYGTACRKKCLDNQKRFTLTNRRNNESVITNRFKASSTSRCNTCKITLIDSKCPHCFKAASSISASNPKQLCKFCHSNPVADGYMHCGDCGQVWHCAKCKVVISQMKCPICKGEPPKWRCNCGVSNAYNNHVCSACDTADKPFTCANCGYLSLGNVCQRCLVTPIVWICPKCECTQHTAMCEKCNFLSYPWRCACGSLARGMNCINCLAGLKSYRCPICQQDRAGTWCFKCHYLLLEWYCTTCFQLSRGHVCINCKKIPLTGAGNAFIKNAWVQKELLTPPQALLRRLSAFKDEPFQAERKRNLTELLKRRSIMGCTTQQVEIRIKCVEDNYSKTSISDSCNRATNMENGVKSSNLHKMFIDDSKISNPSLDCNLHTKLFSFATDHKSNIRKTLSDNNVNTIFRQGLSRSETKYSSIKSTKLIRKHYSSLKVITTKRNEGERLFDYQK